MVTWGLLGPDQRGNPITSIAACCACAARGHAAVPPSSVMNSRRFNCSNGIRCPASRIAGYRISQSGGSVVLWVAWVLSVRITQRTGQVMGGCNESIFWIVTNITDNAHHESVLDCVSHWFVLPREPRDVAITSRGSRQVHRAFCSDSISRLISTAITPGNASTTANRATVIIAIMINLPSGWSRGESPGS